MSLISARRSGGRHRRAEVSTSGRFAVAALTATTIASTPAVANAAPADSANAQITPQTPVTPAATSADNGSTSVVAAKSEENAPMVLASSNFSPNADLGSYLLTALQYNQERLARDLQLRAPLVAKPAEGTFTSPFGPRWGSFHNGIDIANAIGTPILAVLDGTVIDSGPAQGYGQWIRIRHDDGAVSVYGHMESLYVAAGQRVTAGQAIAAMGNQGFSTGPHLHFEIHPDGVTPVDPVSWFEARGVTIA